MSERDEDHRAGDPARPRGRRERRGRGRPGYHDPTSGMAGAAPAQSALTLRLVLAFLGLVVCGAGAVLLAWVRAPVGFTLVAATLAVVAIVDIVVIVRRKRRGEPG